MTSYPNVQIKFHPNNHKSPQNCLDPSSHNWNFFFTCSSSKFISMICLFFRHHFRFFSNIYSSLQCVELRTGCWLFTLWYQRETSFFYFNFFIVGAARVQVLNSKKSDLQACFLSRALLNKKFQGWPCHRNQNFPHFKLIFFSLFLFCIFFKILNYTSSFLHFFSWCSL